VAGSRGCIGMIISTRRKNADLCVFWMRDGCGEHGWECGVDRDEPGN
jgi:hypothetical protein